VSVVELSVGAAIYFPPQEYRERDWLQEGVDPPLCILDIFNHLPQLACRHEADAPLGIFHLVESLPTKAVEHPLEQEHLPTRGKMSGRQASGSNRGEWCAARRWISL